MDKIYFTFQCLFHKITRIYNLMSVVYVIWIKKNIPMKSTQNSSTLAKKETNDKTRNTQFYCKKQTDDIIVVMQIS